MKVRSLPVLLFVPLALLLAACAAGPFPRPAADSAGWDGGPVVRTRFGLVQGRQDADCSWVWKAVPFARPPVGELRWRAPQEPEPWSGVRYSPRYSRPAVQYIPLTERIVGSEDCLYLNIWRPRSYRTGLPVYVWIHGGGNSTGSATYVKYYHGHNLARAGNLVYVSVNYRLGPLGWFRHSSLREGRSAEDGSGNYGTLDLIAALRWIRDNIAAFGGDPGNVLVAGESAGAMNVFSLLACPAAEGLFHRAVVQSGLLWTSSPAEAEHRARQAVLRLLEKNGPARNRRQAEQLLDSMPAGELQAFLRGCSPRELLRCYTPSLDNPTLITDGTVLPADGFASFERGDYPVKVPLILGSNRDEAKSFLWLSSSPSWRSELYQAAARFGSERWKAEGVDGPARRLADASGQPPVYAYLFGWGSPDGQGSSPLPGNWGRRLGAFHSLEIPFFLGAQTTEESLVGAVLYNRANRDGRLALTAAMQRYLAAFLRTGDPNPRGKEAPLPRWEPWSNAAGGPKTLLLDVRGQMLDIRMTDREATPEGIEAAMQAELSPELLEATREILSRPLTGRRPWRKR